MSSIQQGVQIRKLGERIEAIEEQVKSLQEMLDALTAPSTAKKGKNGAK